jgi:hypothetical protein
MKAPAVESPAMVGTLVETEGTAVVAGIELSTNVVVVTEDGAGMSSPTEFCVTETHDTTDMTPAATTSRRAIDAFRRIGDPADWPEIWADAGDADPLLCPQVPQNAPPSGFSLPHCLQYDIERAPSATVPD